MSHSDELTSKWKFCTKFNLEWPGERDVQILLTVEVYRSIRTQLIPHWTECGQPNFWATRQFPYCSWLFPMIQQCWHSSSEGSQPNSTHPWLLPMNCQVHFQSEGVWHEHILAPNFSKAVSVEGGLKWRTHCILQKPNHPIKRHARRKDRVY